MAILVVVNDRVALDAVNLPDKKTIDVKITASDNEILGSEFLWCRHDQEITLSGLQGKGETPGQGV
jgi:hypothetical protein